MVPPSVGDSIALVPFEKLKGRCLFGRLVFHIGELLFIHAGSGSVDVFTTYWADLSRVLHILIVFDL